MTDRIKRANQKAKENRIIRNANRLRSACKGVIGSGRIHKHEDRIAERNSR